MRTIIAPLAVALAVAAPVAAQTTTHKPSEKPAPTAAAKPAPGAANGPKELGKFDDWIAATHQESGQTTCYAFVRSSHSAPALPGRGPVILTVTQRQGSRDEVAITAGYTFPKGASVTLQVLATGLDFYTAGSDAFARDGKASVAAFQKGSEALSRAPGPKEGQVIADTFSLRGFSAAYAAINKACPAR
jgi:hypothetical protein